MFDKQLYFDILFEECKLNLLACVSVTTITYHVRIFHSPLAQSQPLGLCKGTVTGVWKTVGIPTGRVRP